MLAQLHVTIGELAGGMVRLLGWVSLLESLHLTQSTLNTCDDWIGRHIHFKPVCACACACVCVCACACARVRVRVRVCLCVCDWEHDV